MNELILQKIKTNFYSLPFIEKEQFREIIKLKSLREIPLALEEIFIISWFLNKKI